MKKTLKILLSSFETFGVPTVYGHPREISDAQKQLNM
jgi:hypothetical protein